MLDSTFGYSDKFPSSSAVKGVGKIYSTNTRKRTLQRCKDGKFSTSKGTGSCSWHGGKGLKQRRGKQGDLFGDSI